ncbi:MAG TPA: DegV family protein [Chloroflexota bacterium]|jgi:DegV family protein with EDD domain|nr:DegV family protein [Chloroflexota bacterium]
MTSIGLVTDSTADLSPALLEQYRAAFVPLVINWEGQTLRDKVDLSTADFYRRLRTSKSLPKTGAPSLASFEAIFREQLQQHDEVISVNLASKLSGTCDVARRAAQSVDPQRIHVVDSTSVSIGISWLLELTARLSNEGVEPGEIIQRVEAERERIRIYFVVDTLEFLQRGGRIGRGAALAGTLLSVKPILQLHDGEVLPLERVRTMNGALRRLVELVVALGPVERIGVIDGDAETNASEVKRQLEAHFPELTISRGELGPVVGTHGGPGVVGVGVLRRDASD